MDKYALVEQKIASFFTFKSEEKKTDKTALKIIISCDGTKMRYELYGLNNAFLGYYKIEDIFNLNFIEKAITSYNKVEQTLIATIDKLAIEFSKTRKDIQLLILPQKQYFVLENRKKTREINLTEIL